VAALSGGGRVCATPRLPLFCRSSGHVIVCQCCACTCWLCVLREIKTHNNIKPAHNSINYTSYTLQQHGNICYQFNKQCFNTIYCIDWQRLTQHLVPLKLFCNYCIFLLTTPNQALFLHYARIALNN
jgi:hypothetical protein